MRRILTLLVTVAALMAVTAGSASAAPTNKTDVCHYGADADTFHLISISPRALDRHIAHGDAAPGTGDLDRECTTVAASTAPSMVVDGSYDDGRLQIAFTIRESPEGDFSGTASYVFDARGYSATTEFVDACIDPTNSRATAWGPITAGTLSGFMVVTMELRSDGSIWAFSRLKGDSASALSYFAGQCAGPPTVLGPGKGHLNFF